MVLQLQRHPCRVLRQSRNMLQWGSHPGTDFQWVSNGFNDFHFKRVHMSRITQGSQVHNVTSTYLSGRFRWQGTGNVWICVNMCDMLWFLVLFIGFRGDYQLTSADISWHQLTSADRIWIPFWFENPKLCERHTMAHLPATLVLDFGGSIQFGPSNFQSGEIVHWNSMGLGPVLWEAVFCHDFQAARRIMMNHCRLWVGLKIDQTVQTNPSEPLPVSSGRVDGKREAINRPETKIVKYVTGPM